MLHSLLQYHVLSDSLELARILVSLGSNESKRYHSDSSMQVYNMHYEPAYQLGLDMLKKLKSNEEVVYALLNEGLIMRALDYALESNCQALKQSPFLLFVERLKTEGMRVKSDFVMKRISDLKRQDEVRRASSNGDPNFKPLFVD